MLLIACPHCGERAQVEFVYERTLDSIVALDAAPDDAMRTLYTRANPRGWDEELWRHAYGCGKWFLAARDTVTMRVWGTYPATLAAPTDAIHEAIAADRPGWGLEPGMPERPEGAQ